MSRSTIQPEQRALQTRIICLQFPYLEADRIMRARHGKQWRKQSDIISVQRLPMVHVHKHKNAMRIAALDEQAQMLGLTIDQGLADARAQIPDLDILAHMPDADKALLTAIADWCDRYTPLVAFDKGGGHGLYLDITGCAHLFGGEHAMVRDLLERLFHQGFCARAAVAATAGAAHAAARYGHSETGQPIHIASGGERQALAPFGLAALRLPQDTVDGLARVGIKTIAQLSDMARAPVARRFGRQCLLRLGQALGELDEVLSPRLPIAEISAERRLQEPVSQVDDIRLIVHRLGLYLKDQMEARGVGGRMFEASLFRVDGAVKRLRVGTSQPLRDPERIVGLFTERLASLGDDIDAGYGFDIIRLTAPQHAPLDHNQGDFSKPDEVSNDIAGLIDRIGARLGFDGDGTHPVQRAVRAESHMPERAELRAAYNCVPCSGTVDDERPVLPPRPLRFFTRPEPIDVMAEVPDGAPLRFQWRRVMCQVVRAEGPERIAGEWWHGDGEVDLDLSTRQRDYYRVEDGDGRRYWLFRSGLYDDAQAAQIKPRWYMQGLFA